MSRIRGLPGVSWRGGTSLLIGASLAWGLAACGADRPQGPGSNGGHATGPPVTSSRPDRPTPSGSAGGPDSGFQANGCWVGRLGDGPNSMHGDGTWVYADGSTHHLIADLGDITAVSNGTVTLRRADGSTVEAPTGPGSCITMNGQQTDVSGLGTGVRALLVQENGVVTTIRAGQPILTPQDQCTLKDDLVTGDVRVEYEDGSSREFHDDRGTVTSVDAQTLSVKRPDGKEVSLQLDQVGRTLVNCSPSTASALAVGQYVDVISESGHAHIITAQPG